MNDVMIPTLLWLLIIVGGWATIKLVCRYWEIEIKQATRHGPW